MGVGAPGGVGLGALTRPAVVGRVGALDGRDEAEVDLVAPGVANLKTDTVTAVVVEIAAEGDLNAGELVEAPA